MARSGTGRACPSKLRSILTVALLVGKGLVDPSFQYHVENARKTA
ncbi:hypothetical protein [uncultured Oscillibacter sp.]|nr:hypothetical protein [uncultured Oscillibacter sp.]